uniref:ribonuclease Z n=1 Tax=Catenella fusiformis TaxID=3024791 RepID=UPI0027DA5FB3|nr:ribonuclease Z [Catenella fusiformis]WCH57436.1 ribonuclease Z [Catenella fusiformis]
MEIINLTRRHPSIMQVKTSFIISFPYLKEIWLFNCCQGCQHIIEKQYIKISQISKIIITEVNIENISGLLGLLSSLSLINRKKTLNIYSVKGIEQYLKFGKKYSQTNFRYNLYCHILKTGIIIKNENYQVYSFLNSSKFEFLLISRKLSGKFKLNQAQNFNLVMGPLYGKLKDGYIFLLPDGLIIEGQKFTDNSQSGLKVSLIINRYNQRNSLEISYRSKVLQGQLII